MQNGSLRSALMELLQWWQSQRREQVVSFVAAYRAAHDGATPAPADVARGVDPPLPLVLAAYYLEAGSV